MSRAKKSPAVASPCATCPWHKQSQTPEAVKASPLDGLRIHWFDPENLRDRWQGVANGQLMPCHATDKNAHLYGGKRSKAKQSRTCVGLSILARREVTAFMEDGTDFDRYSRRPGERMTARGLATWASRLLFSGAVLLIGREKLTLPVVEDSPDVRFPWDDSINPSCTASNGRKRT